MKKQIVVAIAMMIPTIGFAKVADFNALISENVKAQSELHDSVKQNVSETRKVVADANRRERIIIVENSGNSFNSPTKKDMLVFQKEKTFHRADDGIERLAAEVRDQE